MWAMGDDAMDFVSLCCSMCMLPKEFGVLRSAGGNNHKCFLFVLARKSSTKEPHIIVVTVA